MNIIICRADELVDKVAKLKPAAVLSIEGPEARPDDASYAPRLKDVLPHSAASDTPQMILKFFDYPEENGPGGPDIEQVEAGLAFIMERITKGDVIIHCTLGKSRSAAIALGVLSQLHPHATEAELLEKLLAIRPIAAPNIIVVGMVDELTGRGGRLVKAVLDHPGLTAAREAAIASRAEYIKKHPIRINPPQNKPKNNAP